MASTWQTLGNLFTVIRSLSNKDSTTLSDATLLPLANKYYFLLVRELIGLDEDLYAEISSADLVVNQREYALPSDDTTGTPSASVEPYGGGLIKIQRVEVSYTSGEWKVAQSLNFSGIQTPTILDSDVANSFSSASPRYFFKDNSVWLFPVPTVAISGGLRIFWTERPAELTATSDLPDLPKDWLAVLQEGILYDVFRKFERTSDARDALANWQIGIGRMKELEQKIDEGAPLRMQLAYKNYR